MRGQPRSSSRLVCRRPRRSVAACRRHGGVRRRRLDRRRTAAAELQAGRRRACRVCVRRGRLPVDRRGGVALRAHDDGDRRRAGAARAVGDLLLAVHRRDQRNDRARRDAAVADDRDDRAAVRGVWDLAIAFLPRLRATRLSRVARQYRLGRQGHRLVSTILDPEYAGAIAMALLVHSRSCRRARAWPDEAAPPARRALTASRGSLLAFIVGLSLILLVRGRSKRLLSVLALVAVGVALALPSSWPTASFNKLRLDDPSALARKFSPGRAAGHYFAITRSLARFNTWARSGAARMGPECGRLGVRPRQGTVVHRGAHRRRRARALWLNVLLAWRGRARLARRTQAGIHRGLAIGIAAASVALVVHSLFTNSLLLPFLMEPLWVLWALGFVMSVLPALLQQCYRTARVRAPRVESPRCASTRSYGRHAESARTFAVVPRVLAMRPHWCDSLDRGARSAGLDVHQRRDRSCDSGMRCARTVRASIQVSRRTALLAPHYVVRSRAVFRWPSRCDVVTTLSPGCTVGGTPGPCASDVQLRAPTSGDHDLRLGSRGVRILAVRG